MSSGVTRGRGAAFLDKIYEIFLNKHVLICYIAYLLIVNHLTVLPDALAQSCKSGPTISFSLRCIPASIIKI